MLIIEGPNLALRDQLIKELKKLAPAESQHISGFDRNRDLKWLVDLVACDHRLLIYQGFPNIANLTRGQRHMLLHALAASGSMVVCCANSQDLNLGFWGTFPATIETMVLSCKERLAVASPLILKRWRDLITAASPTWEFGSTGGLPGDAVMLVGDRVHPFVPLDVRRRQAFVSHHGSSHWLHTAMAETGRHNFYVTNAHKVVDSSANCIMLTDEIMRVNPKRIIAMGDEAAAYMSELDAPFVRTYHPQYWSRFKNSHTKDFTNLLMMP